MGDAIGSLAHVQEEIGSSGRFGETFIGLGVLILAAGIAMLGVANGGVFSTGTAGAAGANDGLIVGIFFVVEGIGFTIFGAVAILAGWDRHRDHEQ